MAEVAFDVKQTQRGLQLVGTGPRPSRHVPPLTVWPSHLYVPRLFYLWALDNDGKTGAWAVAKVRHDKTELHFYLDSGQWGRYELAHAASGGHHYDLLDSGTAPGAQPS